MIDPLTTLPDAQDLDALLANTKFPSIFKLDIKNFKNINLKYGDECGDKVLQTFAHNLKAFAAPHDMDAFRLHNDAFVLLSKAPFELEKIESLLIEIPESLQHKKIIFSGNDVVISYNMGISIDHFNTLLKADIALKVAKAQDQEYMTYSLFAKNLLDENAKALQQLIATAIEKERISPYFQPVVDAHGNRAFCEVLTRFDDADNLQSPILFFNLAHQFGRYKELLEVMLHKLVTILEQKPATVSLNISQQDLEDEAILQMMLSILREKDILFELDIKNFKDDANASIAKLKAAGIKVLLDNVKSFDVCEGIDFEAIDFIKLHPDTTREVNIQQYQDLVGTLKRYGKPMIATGINSQQSYEIAKAMGCEYFQGFLIARPKKEI
ncbi:EAL domain-containing protein [Sulfurospirillum sp. 1612]|uniref:EAL domain-containing protein n=1 Tax=Sulfurospirillum sp. 1612 TaxID=3094835 RepID=UPI002F9238A2